MGFSRQEYLSGLPFPFPGDLLDPGIKPRSPGLQADSLPSEPPGKNLFRFPCLNGLLTNFHLQKRGGSTETVSLMLLLLKCVVSTEGCQLWGSSLWRPVLANWVLRQAQVWGLPWWPFVSLTLSHAVVNKGGRVVSWDCLDRCMLESQICFFKKKTPKPATFIYWFIWLLWVLAVACGIYFLDQGSNPGPYIGRVES